MSTNEERKILDGIRDGNEQAIKVFYQNNYSYIKSYILNNSGDTRDAEDVFQDALVVIYEKLKEGSLNIHENVTVRSYLYGVCKNLWLSRLRKRKKMIVDPGIIKENEGTDISISEELEKKEREHLYRKYFLALSDSCKEILRLVFDGKSMKEIASITKYSEGHARKKKYDCKKSLIEKLEKDPMYKELKVTSIKE
ncbi:RNA polymerase sigma factor [Aquimarina litoralis]|uniref:RNA polymerase sigma factor n=1 Tax=Aquimarina litoralis TaxID=584605 RepID=UPI001C57D35F|nr:sigma-70 family RNA polymerase sigma factor [Aquimarina litoralis]MBW1295303.1 sigma-70 family RNA polymerase sigma factor [Aquimarina litoralis]